MAVHLGSSSTANLVHKWQPSTAYTAGDKVMAPDGTIVSRIADGTSGTSFSSANWTTVGGAVASVNGLTGAVVIDEVSIVVYSGSVGTVRPGAEFVVWQGFPTQPTNMADGDLWLSDTGGVVLVGTVDPTSSDGSNGDLYFNKTSKTIFAPKASGAWPAGVSLAGTNGTNGRGITSIARTSGTGAAGTTDTYTITYSDSTTSTYTVVNGADGAGSSITVKDEGSALSTAATSIDFVGAGVTATGTGAAKTVTIPGGSGFVPASKYTLPSGAVAATFDRAQVAMTSVTLTSGTIYPAGVVLRAGDLVSSLTFKTIGGYSGATHTWAGVADSSRVILAISADDTSASLGTNTTKTLTMGTPYTVPTEGLYYFFLMIAATTPQVMGANGFSTQQTNIAPILAATAGTGQTTPPASGATLAALTANNAVPYIWAA